MEVLQVSTKSKSDWISLNREINELLVLNEIQEGLCIVFVPHTTAGLTINENADVDVKKDFLQTLDKLVPWDNCYNHLEGNSAAHIKASLMGFSVTVLIEEGQLVLGTWQDIYLVEFDGPRVRKVYVKFV